MTQIQFKSITHPLDLPGVSARACRILSYAGVIGALPEGISLVTLDYEAVLGVVRELLKQTGAGRDVVLMLQGQGGRDPKRLYALLGQLYDELEESPAPDREWRPLIETLGASQLADLVGISPASLNRYQTGARRTPDDVAQRLHCLALVVSDLAGAYNAFGLRRWFGRPRSALGRRTPAMVFHGNWKPESSDARKVRELASSLTSSPAT